MRLWYAAVAVVAVAVAVAVVIYDCLHLLFAGVVPCAHDCLQRLVADILL